MQPGQEPADAARARLVAELSRPGHTLSEPVRRAFERVPRHLFVPEVAAAAAYRDEALVVKCGPDGLPVSSSSQPAMMAIMIGQLGLMPGHRVLEIGTGTGYNAAVMAEVTGPSGQVVSIDIDPELTGRAAAALQAAGYPDVRVLCGDGGYGDPAGAPFDRIIVTAGAWDIAPAWLDQLAPGGLLVLPLSVRGIQLSVALRQVRPGQWQSVSAWRCGFVRMLGAFAGPEAAFRLEGPQALTGQMADGRPADLTALQSALSQPPVSEPVPVPLTSLADVADLDLWLTLTATGLDRVTLLAAPGAWFPPADLLPLGALVSGATEPGRMGVAMLLPADETSMVVAGYGPGGSGLAGTLAGLAAEWPDLGRPGAAHLRLTVSHGQAEAEPPQNAVIAVRPSVLLSVSWDR